MAGRQADHFAQELFVDLAQDFAGEDREFVGARGVVEVAKDFFERLVVEDEPGREGVGRLGAAFFGVEVEEAGVVAVVSFAEELGELFVNRRLVEERLQPAVGFDAPVLAHAQEEDTVDRDLDGVVEIAGGKVGITEGEVLGQQLAPGFDLGQESGINGSRAALAFL